MLVLLRCPSPRLPLTKSVGERGGGYNPSVSAWGSSLLCRSYADVNMYVFNS